MDRGSAKHGPHLDEAMAGEVSGYVRARRDTHAAEWRSPEPPAGDVSLVFDRRDGIGRGGGPPGMTFTDVEERSELARWLGRAVFPASRGEVLEHLRHQNAPDHLLEEVRAVPEKARFRSVGELWRTLRDDAHVELPPAGRDLPGA
ncbi:DUF2795 domain-containing protein [Frankia sp. CNm7]|uniref:DUF2795 domain-containing protein n=1 Tax=Frankia nepalensis TaxID=1836974 RepID=A0A937UVK8_9ACTN|nr:DUF2795 domain-containing protein [Frankia nepalensis]MBL7499588.1 DUF2795 domain-containing protein [Frankia nepalensis]MBL7513077.1 DUF2795 domain-containing protein [Frankia nepalensis]MBL7517992.1 DUF2795 domain-containing protein [Frankia nepalensis]MBL7632371.1 DUF2795 domain-containing protein [Frankia nepalensis]